MLFSLVRENMLHKISAGRREIGDNSFLRDFKARMLSSRRAMSRSMILRATSNGSSAEHEVLVSSGRKQLEF
jgi:hypothetical protein